jgi:hypothetical protein
MGAILNDTHQKKQTKFERRLQKFSTPSSIASLLERPYLSQKDVILARRALGRLAKTNRSEALRLTEKYIHRLEG